MPKPTLQQLDIPKENTRLGLALVGPYGNVWHDALFEAPEDAIRYLTTYWRGVEWNPQDWKVVQATQVITPLKDTPEFPLSNYMPQQPEARDASN